MKGELLIKILFVFGFLAKVVVVVLPTLTVGSVDWLLPMIVSLIFIGVGLFILMAGSSLVEYHVDHVTLALFLVFGTVLRLDSVASNTIGLALKVMVWAVCAAILLAVLTGRIKPARPTWAQIAYLVPAAIVGMLLALVDGYVIIHKQGFHVEQSHAQLYLSANYIARSLAYQASNAGIPEEFLFRGLLWGYLVSRSHSEGRAAIAQGTLFWIWHFDQALVSPVSFWCLLPALAALVSWLAWRSRSLLASVTAHTTYNAFQVVMAIMLATRL